MTGELACSGLMQVGANREGDHKRVACRALPAILIILATQHQQIDEVAPASPRPGETGELCVL